MRRFLPIVWILSLGGCELYNLENGLDLWLDIPPIVKSAQPEIKYEIRGAFDVELRFESLSNQATWIQENELTTRLSERSGSLQFSQPLKNTRYRILARAITRRSGNEILMDEVFREYAMEVVLGTPTLGTVQTIVSTRSSGAPIDATITLTGIGLRPSSIIVLIDTVFTITTNIATYPTYGYYVFGFGQKISDLGAGVEQWRYTIPFNCHGSFESDGTNSFATNDPNVYIYILNAGEFTENDPSQLLYPTNPVIFP